MTSHLITLLHITSDRITSYCIIFHPMVRSLTTALCGSSLSLRTASIMDSVGRLPLIALNVCLMYMSNCKKERKREMETRKKVRGTGTQRGDHWNLGEERRGGGYYSTSKSFHVRVCSMCVCAYMYLCVCRIHVLACVRVFYTCMYVRTSHFTFSLCSSVPP